MVQPGPEPFSTSNKTGDESEVDQAGLRGSSAEKHKYQYQAARGTIERFSLLHACSYCFKGWGINSTYLFKACQLHCLNLFQCQDE